MTKYGALEIEGRRRSDRDFHIESAGIPARFCGAQASLPAFVSL